MELPLVVSSKASGKVDRTIEKPSGMTIELPIDEETSVKISIAEAFENVVDKLRNKASHSKSLSATPRLKLIEEKALKNLLSFPRSEKHLGLSIGLYFPN